MAVRTPRLRRTTDRVEDLTAWLLLATGMVLTLISCAFGVRLHDQLIEQGRAEASERTPGVAQLIDAAPRVPSGYAAGSPVMVAATWRDQLRCATHGSGERVAGSGGGEHRPDLDRPFGLGAARADLHGRRPAQRDRRSGCDPRGRGDPVGLRLGARAAGHARPQLRPLGTGMARGRAGLDPGRGPARLSRPELKWVWRLEGARAERRAAWALRLY